MDEKTIKQISQNLKTHAKGLDLPIGSAEVFIEKSLNSAKKSLAKRSIVTEDDITRIIAKELHKYNSDLAYIYENHDKII